MQPISNNNDFFGIRISQPGINVQQAGPKQLVYQSDYSTETWYDNSGNTTLKVGSIGTSSAPAYGMSVPATNGTINYGSLSDGSLGMQVTDSNGNLVFEMNGTTWYWYDTSGNIVMEVGYLSLLGVYGWAVAVPGASLKGEV
jgi:hypothetical protein